MGDNDAWSPTQPRTATPPPPPPPARPSLSPAPRPDDNGNDADRSDGHPEYDDQDAHYSAPQLRHAEYRAERDLKDDDNGDNDDDDDDDARRFYDGEERERQPLPPLPMAPRSEGRSETGSSDANPGNNLHVSGVSKLLTDQQLEEPFSKFGKVLKTQVMHDPHTRESRGFAFVTFETAEEADAAIAGMNGVELSGRTLVVQKARRARARSPTPGRYRGHQKARGPSSGYGHGRYGGGSGWDRWGAPPPLPSRSSRSGSGFYGPPPPRGRDYESWGPPPMSDRWGRPPPPPPLLPRGRYDDRYDRYDRYDRFDRYDRYDRYAAYGPAPLPPRDYLPPPPPPRSAYRDYSPPPPRSAYRDYSPPRSSRRRYDDDYPPPRRAGRDDMPLPPPRP